MDGHLHCEASARPARARRAVKSHLSTAQYEIDIVGYVLVADRTRTTEVEQRIGDQNNGSRQGPWACNDRRQSEKIEGELGVAGGLVPTSAAMVPVVDCARAAYGTAFRSRIRMIACR
jgi:hypothetical protein